MRPLACISTWRRARSRCGIATVELAVCLPMLMVIAMGTMETADFIFLKERLKTAAYEGVRTTSAPGQTSDGGIAAASAILTQRGVVAGTVTVNPSNVTSLTTTGTQITVTVTAPFASNTYMRPFVLGGFAGDVSASVTMIRQ